MTIMIVAVVGIGLVVSVPILLGHIAFSVTPEPSRRNPDSLDLAYQDIHLRNDDGDMLHGWWIPHPSASEERPAPTLLFVHGWDRNCQRMLPYMRASRSLPVNMLAIDGRGHGENRKDHFITVVGLAEDISAALDWLVARPETDVHRVGVISHSFGAAAAILAASRDDRIGAFIADGSFANPADIMETAVTSRHLPYFPVGWLIKHYIQLRLNTTFQAIAPENNIGSVDVPGLLVHGGDDSVIPVGDSHRIFRNAGENIRRWIAEGADHSDTTDHPEFSEVLHDFLSDALVDPPVDRVERSSGSLPSR